MKFPSSKSGWISRVSRAINTTVASVGRFRWRGLAEGGSELMREGKKEARDHSMFETRELSRYGKG